MNKILLISAILLSACSYIIYQWITPVEIVAVHDGKTVLVRHFPYLKSRQIAWWEENKNMIQEKYGIPKKITKDITNYFFKTSAMAIVRLVEPIRIQMFFALKI